MSVRRLSPLCLILALASSALATYYPWSDPAIQPLSFSPHLFYGSGLAGGTPDLNGFSYFTKDLSGGESDVVFFHGPDSDAKLAKAIAALKEQFGSVPSAKTAATKSGKDTSDAAASQGDEIAPLIPAGTKEPAKQEEETSKAADPEKEDKKESDAIPVPNDADSLPDIGAEFAAPYPILRLGAAAYPHQFPTSFTGFVGFEEPADYFRSEYRPVLNRYNYQSIYNPLYSSLDGNFENADVSLLYQSPVIASSSFFDTVDDLLAKKPQEGAIKGGAVAGAKIDRRLGVVGEGEKKTEASASEKGTELPTTTEQTEDKSTTTSEAAVPTTTADDGIKEAATTVVSDAVAAP